MGKRKLFSPIYKIIRIVIPSSDTFLVNRFNEFCWQVRCKLLFSLLQSLSHLYPSFCTSFSLISYIPSFLPHTSRNLSSPNPPSPSISLFLSPSLSLSLFLPSSLANMQMILCKNFHILNTARNANIIPYTRAYTSSSLIQVDCATYALHSLLTYRMCIDIDRTTHITKHLFIHIQQEVQYMNIKWKE